jgi:hypothetical protein
MYVIPPTKAVEIRRVTVQGQPGQKSVSKIPSKQKKPGHSGTLCLSSYLRRKVGGSQSRPVPGKKHNTLSQN